MNKKEARAAIMQKFFEKFKDRKMELLMVKAPPPIPQCRCPNCLPDAPRMVFIDSLSALISHEP